MTGPITAEDMVLIERLRRRVDSGRRTLGGASMTTDHEGKVVTTSYGGEPIMVLANPDGPAAVDLIERLAARTPDAATVERLTAALERIIGMGGDIDRCTCGRPTGIPGAGHVRPRRPVVSHQREGRVG